MSGEMGTFRVGVEIENPARPGEKRMVRSALGHTGAELSWFPRDVLQSLGIEPVKAWHFRQADGTVLRRWTGGVSVYLAGIWTLDEVVFGEPRDLVLLGSRSLEGLNLRIDPAAISIGTSPASARRIPVQIPTNAESRAGASGEGPAGPPLVCRACWAPRSAAYRGSIAARPHLRRQPGIHARPCPCPADPERPDARA